MSQSEIVKISINSEVGLHFKDRRGRTPVHFVAKSGDVKIATVLVNKKVNLNARDNMRVIPLHVTIYNQNLSIVDLLLKCGANSNAKDCFSNAPFDLLACFLPDPVFRRPNRLSISIVWQCPSL